MKKTKIEWCDSTFNPVTGCLHGCEYCYARRIANRFTGLDGTSSDGLLELSERRDKPYPEGEVAHTETTERPRTVFVGSMCDLFGDWIPDEWIIKKRLICIFINLRKGGKKMERYTD
jgi:protein gp37